MKGKSYTVSIISWEIPAFKKRASITSTVVSSLFPATSKKTSLTKRSFVSVGILQVFFFGIGFGCSEGIDSAEIWESKELRVVGTLTTRFFEKAPLFVTIGIVSSYSLDGSSLSEDDE